MMSTVDALSQSLPFYETPLRESLQSWWQTAAETPTPLETRVPKRLLLPAMGLGALAALSLYHRLLSGGPAAVIVPDPVPSSDHLRAHNPATKAPKYASLNHRLSSILFAIHDLRNHPAALNAIAETLNITSQTSSMLMRSSISSTKLSAGILEALFSELPDVDAMLEADYALIDTRLRRTSSEIVAAIDRVSRPVLHTPYP
jgi:hypothetical protein